MGAGDSIARTIIGRYEMRMRAAREAIEEGVDLKDVTKVCQRSMEENFRTRSVFSRKMSTVRFVGNDKAAKMAGDEAAMTTASARKTSKALS